MSTTPGSDLPFRTILLTLSALSTCRLPWRSPLDPNDLERTRRVQDCKFRNRFRYSFTGQYSCQTRYGQSAIRIYADFSFFSFFRLIRNNIPSSVSISSIFCLHVAQVRSQLNPFPNQPTVLPQIGQRYSSRSFALKTASPISHSSCQKVVVARDDGI